MYNPNDARKLLTLPNSNTAENIVRCRIPKGTPFIEGKVASQTNDVTNTFGDYAVGGGNQLYFLKEDLDKIKILEIFKNQEIE